MSWRRFILAFVLPRRPRISYQSSDLRPLPYTTDPQRPAFLLLQIILRMDPWLVDAVLTTVVARGRRWSLGRPDHAIESPACFREEWHQKGPVALQCDSRMERKRCRCGRTKFRNSIQSHTVPGPVRAQAGGPSMSSYRKPSGGRRTRIELLLPRGSLFSHVKAYCAAKDGSGPSEHPLSHHRRL